MTSYQSLLHGLSGLFRALHRFIAFLDNVWFIRGVLIQALTCCVTEREEQRRRGRERRKERKSVLLRRSRQSRRTRREYEVAGALCFFCTNATSGIMRRRRLMCESRKERGDGIAIATKSIASSSPPEGFCGYQTGETREEGGHILDMFALGYLSLPSINGVMTPLIPGWCFSKQEIKSLGVAILYLFSA